MIIAVNLPTLKAVHVVEEITVIRILSSKETFLCLVKFVRTGYAYTSKVFMLSVHINLLMPLLPITLSNVITFNQIWHHLYASSVRGKDLSNDTSDISGHESAQKRERKSQNKISLNYIWLLCDKNFPFR